MEAVNTNLDEKVKEMLSGNQRVLETVSTKNYKIFEKISNKSPGGSIKLRPKMSETWNCGQEGHINRCCPRLQTNIPQKFNYRTYHLLDNNSQNINALSRRSRK